MDEEYDAIVLGTGLKVIKQLNSIFMANTISCFDNIVVNKCFYLYENDRLHLGAAILEVSSPF